MFGGTFGFDRQKQRRTILCYYPTRMSLWTDPQIVNHRIDEPGAISFYTSQGNLLKRNYTKIERREISQKKNRKRKPEKIPYRQSSLDDIIPCCFVVLFVQSSLCRRIDSYCVVVQECNFAQRVR